MLGTKHSIDEAWLSVVDNKDSTDKGIHDLA